MRRIRLLTASIAVVALASLLVVATVATGPDGAPNAPGVADEVGVPSPRGPEQDATSSSLSSSTTSPVVAGDDSDPTDERPPVHDVIVTDHAVSAAGADQPVLPLAELDRGGIVPEGIDLAALPGAPAAVPRPPVQGAVSFSAGPGCRYQCITEGLAYPRGFGAELVVATSVPANVFLSIAADTTGDGNYNFADSTNSFGRVTDFSWAIDHLEPAQEYIVMAVATDEYDDTSYAWGRFTTLSQRNVIVGLGDVDIYKGPSNVVQTRLLLGVNGSDGLDYSPGVGSTYLYEGVGRRLDLKLWVTRSWPGDLCEGWESSMAPTTFGRNDDSCLAWNTAVVDDVDLDVPPAGRTRWTGTIVRTTLRTPTDVGALPPGFSIDHYFSFVAPVAVLVSYS
jgi:hypothetical protein